MSDNVQRPSEAWERIKPFALRDLRTLIFSGKSTGGTSEGYVIMLYVRANQKIRRYSVTEDGLKAALAAASSGDVVVLPAGTISGNQTVPDGVSLVGIDRRKCLLTGEIRLGAGSSLGEVSVIRSGSSANPLYGVVLDNSAARMYDCLAEVNNAGGDAVAVLGTAGSVGAVDDCILSGYGSGDGYGCFADAAEITIQGGSAEGSTAPIGAI